MIQIDRSKLSPAMSARLDAALAKRFRDGEAIRTLAELIEARAPTYKTIADGSCDYNRRRFNAMTGPEQRAYEARLAAKRYYTVWNGDIGLPVPKLVYDALVLPVGPRSLAA